MDRIKDCERFYFCIVESFYEKILSFKQFYLNDLSIFYEIIIKVHVQGFSSFPTAKHNIFMVRNAKLFDAIELYVETFIYESHFNSINSY